MKEEPSIQLWSSTVDEAEFRIGELEYKQASKLIQHGAEIFSEVCLLTFVVHKRAAIYSRQWLERENELETHFGGRVFTRILEIEKQDRNIIIHAHPALLFLYPLFALGWALMFYVALAG